MDYDGDAADDMLRRAQGWPGGVISDAGELRKLSPPAAEKPFPLALGIKRSAGNAVSKG